MPARFVPVMFAEQVDELFELSFSEPVIFYKHSSSCGISGGVFQIISDVDAQINMVVVQNAPDLSDTIAERTGVRHESPQTIVVKKGKAVYHASHYDVTVADIETHLKD